MNGTRPFPPPKLQSLSQESASNFLRLIKACQDEPLALFLGAGVSASAGLPPWGHLLERLCVAFLFHWEQEIRGGTASEERPPTGRPVNSTHHDVEELHEFLWNAEDYQEAKEFAAKDPLLVAQLIKNHIRSHEWVWLLRKSLYVDKDGQLHDGVPSALMDSLATLCKICPRQIKSVINYNYDDFMERALTAKGVRHHPIYEPQEKPLGDTLPIYHPHGFLPIAGGPSNNNFVLAESDYNQETAEPYSWSNLPQVRELSGKTCIFIGMSMTDPNLRRLMRLSRHSTTGEHFAFLSKSKPFNRNSTMHDSLFDSDLLAMGIRSIRYNPDHGGEHSHTQLLELMNLLNESIINKDAIWDSV